MSEFLDKILRFNEMYGLPQPERSQLYLGSRLETRKRLEQFKKILLDEIAEVGEIIEDLDAGAAPVVVLAKIADWLGDLQVYAASEMTKYGMNNDEVLGIIMNSNFSKLGSDGKPIIKDGKVQKGPNYWKPEPALEKLAASGGTFERPAQPAPAAEGANTRQVGGSHYKTKHGLEHWDIVDMFDLDYFQGQITKYVMRWRDKGGVQDLRKARHFMDKYIELEEAKDVRVLGSGIHKIPELSPEVQSSMEQLGKEIREMFPGVQEAPKPWEQGVDPHIQDGNAYWQNEGYYGDGTCLYSCRKCKHTTRATAAPGVPHGCGLQGALEPSDTAG